MKSNGDLYLEMGRKLVVLALDEREASQEYEDLLAEMDSLWGRLTAIERREVEKALKAELR